MAYKILIVDDEQTLLQTIRTYLEQEGYEVRTALNGIHGTATSWKWPKAISTKQ